MGCVCTKDNDKTKEEVLNPERYRFLGMLLILIS